jgi:hypothetical protein
MPRKPKNPDKITVAVYMPSHLTNVFDALWDVWKLKNKGKQEDLLLEVLKDGLTFFHLLHAADKDFLISFTVREREAFTQKNFYVTGDDHDAVKEAKSLLARKTMRKISQKEIIVQLMALGVAYMCQRLEAKTIPTPKLHKFT